MLNCLRCGRCCYYEGKRCPYLMDIAPGKTYCRIYPNRLNKWIFTSKEGKKLYCSTREAQLEAGINKGIEGCPLDKN